MSTIYSFTVEDLTAPELESILWLHPRKCRIKWNEAVSQLAVAGGACFVIHIKGVEVLSTSTIRIRGTTPDASWIGYGCCLANTWTRNHPWRAITAVDPAAGTITLDTSLAGALVTDTGVDTNDSNVVVRRRTIKCTISGYKLSARLTAEGAAELPYSPEKIQCSFLPLVVSASTPTAEELPAGELPAQYTYLEWHDDVSFGRMYQLIALGVMDASEGENLSAGSVPLNFVTPDFAFPTGTLLDRIGFWSDGIVAPTDREDDLGMGSGILRKFCVVFQDLLNSLRYRLDQIQYLEDPDHCPDGWVDHLLYKRGNPFRFEMASLLFKRRLAAALPGLYKRVGTVSGIQDFLYRLLGIDFDIQPLINQPGWLLGDLTYGVLGLTTRLAAGTKYEKNCYKVVSPVDLTDTQRRIVRDVCEWADPIWMHLAEIDEPTEPAVEGSTSLGWILGVSALGTETYLG